MKHIAYIPIGILLILVLIPILAILCIFTDCDEDTGYWMGGQ